MVFLMKRVSSRLGGCWCFTPWRAAARLHGAVCSPWHKFLHFLPAPYSLLTSKVDGNVAAPAAGCVSHCSLELGKHKAVPN